MSVIEKIYEAYIAGELSITPPETEQNTQELFDELFKSNSELAQELQDFVFDIADKQGKQLFEAGFKFAVEFILNASER